MDYIRMKSVLCCSIRLILYELSIICNIEYLPSVAISCIEQSLPFVLR